MTKPIIKVENISKQYRLGTIGTGTFSHDANRWWHKVRGKEDPYLKVGEANDRSKSGGSDYVWALKDINFEVQPGEILGIIGKNGAGKSTLLKLLSRVTAPTTGKITCHGRIASLLEVGTGFHPELTGKENVFLNGAILGMTKKEIASKLEEIVDFAGCAKYMDTPVKRYSSGMRVRLGFAVAAFLEPDILVVDEVLAVGDAEFQKKAIGKMKEVSQGEGRTVLFVSHNMESVIKLCDKGIILEKGKVSFEGNIKDAVDKYLSNTEVKNTDLDISKPNITKISLNNKLYTETKRFEVNIEFTSPFEIDTPNFGIVIKNKFHIPVLGTNAIINEVNYTKRKYNKGTVELVIKELNLLPGNYYCDIYLNGNNLDKVFFENYFEFEVLNTKYIKTTKDLRQNILGSLAVDASWKYE